MKVLFTKREFLDNGICIIGKITCKNNGQVYREQLFYKDFNGDKNTLIELLNNNINLFKAKHPLISGRGSTCSGSAGTRCWPAPGSGRSGTP